ncbi:MAG: ABC transporter permease [Kiloniellaceae bacterium]
MAEEPKARIFTLVYRTFMAAFLLYLVMPLLAAGVFAFNDSLFPTLPWQGFTLDWFFNDSEPKLGMFHDGRLLRGLTNSLYIGVLVSLGSVFVGTWNAFLFERVDFPFKRFLYLVMVVPLVIPGVIIGISILLFASMVADGVWAVLGTSPDWLRPGIPLIVLGQCSFLITITSLIIAARLQQFDISQEEAALNLGATRQRALFTVTLPYLFPAMFSAFVVAFLVSFENFNTTMMLVGSDAPLSITMYDRIAKVGSTPVLNAVSVFLMVASGLLALSSVLVQRKRP